MMTGCHHPESLMVMSNLQESVKKKLYTAIPGQIDFVPDYSMCDKNGSTPKKNPNNNNNLTPTSETQVRFYPVNGIMIHNENMPMQYTEIFWVVKNLKFH